MSPITYQSIRVPSRPVPLPLSPFSTSPSTARSSIFSSANSLVSTSPRSPPLPFTPEKRKHGVGFQKATKAGSKRRRVMGRPKNAWTPTRLRKLVRLYMMTNLEHTEIAKVLQDKDFHPGKRDIQKQLECILQPRPNQIRLGPNITKSRLRLLRDCKALRKSRRKTKHLHARSKSQHQANVGKGCVQADSPRSLPILDSGEGGDWAWLQIGADSSQEWALSQSLENFTAQSPVAVSEAFLGKDNDDSVSLNTGRTVDYRNESALFRREGIQGAHQNGSFVHQVWQSMEYSPNLHLSSTRSTSTARPDHISENAELLPDILDQCYENYDQGCGIFPPPSGTLHTHFKLSKTGLKASEKTVDSIQTIEACTVSPHSAAMRGSASGTCQVAQNAYLEDKPDNKSRQPVGGRPSRTSVLSITSLNRRLSFKYPHSYLEDVVSLMERFTISGSSASFSSSRNSDISSKMSSRSFQRQSEILKSLSTVNDPPILPVRIKVSVNLPGIFCRYCTAHVEQNILETCRYDGLLCEHIPGNRSRFFVSCLKSGKVLYRRVASRGINDVDSFGNSILHIAASLGFRIQYIVKLIEENADINAKNAAGETFLHLIYAPTCADDVCFLLELLSIKGFNFGQHDQHGQTCLHLLTRPWLPQHYLIKVIKKIHSLGFVLPTSRDSLGFTLLRQAKHLGTHVLGFDPEKDVAFRLSLGLTCETQGYVIYPHNPDHSSFSTADGNKRLQGYERQALIANVEEQRYVQHANLLRTIVRAGNEPWFEDSKGRNGLHCLAEVEFDLPLPKSPITKAIFSTEDDMENFKTKRERYLDSLILAGVNLNNYDKEGNTPLMAFIIHTRVNEDDDTTTRILTRLINSKADIHRRNRNGETGLHLAVKFGRRAATKLLLRKGANIHARNKADSGVLEIATEAWWKAGRDEKLYAQILLCVSLAMRAGAVPSPTIMQEWELGQRRGPFTS